MKACHKSYQHDESREAKFRKSLRSFFGYNFVIFILMILGMGGVILWKISVIWGAILAFKGYSIYGREERETPGFTTEEEPSREQYGRPRRPEWKDKDLV
jgi:hypothetical protein